MKEKCEPPLRFLKKKHQIHCSHYFYLKSNSVAIPKYFQFLKSLCLSIGTIKWNKMKYSVYHLQNGILLEGENPISVKKRMNSVFAYIFHCQRDIHNRNRSLSAPSVDFLICACIRTLFDILVSIKRRNLFTFQYYD